MKQRRIGDVTVSAIGLGEMPLSIEGRPDEERAMRTIHASLDAGVTIIDTADAYCLNSQEHGHGERLVARALATYIPKPSVGSAWGFGGEPKSSVVSGFFNRLQGEA